LLSDACYPIKSDREIAAKLGAGSFNYLTINGALIHGSSRASPIASVLLKKTERCGGWGSLDMFCQIRVAPARPSKRVIPHKGWQWGSLTHECTQYVLDYVDSNRYFVRSFMPTRIPDETFIHHHCQLRVRPHALAWFCSRRNCWQ